eukprot:scaffold8992_cov154-Skeletonema_dohrnii-CCMP3373.AAC.3
MGSNYGEQIWGARYDANMGSSYESEDTTNSLNQDMATPDILSLLGTAPEINTLDINAAVMFNDEDQLLDEAVELMAFYAAHAC